MTAPTGFTYDGLDPATPNSQTCPATNGPIYFTLHFTGTANPPPASGANGVSASNTAGACSTIVISWATATNDTAYNIARDSQSNIIATITPDPSTPVGTPESYTDNPTSGAHTYYVQGINSFSSSVWVPTGSVAPTPCAVVFSNSDKIVYKVNGAPYKFATSQCIGSSTGNVQTIKAGDTITFRLNLCNDGNIAATGVSVIDTLDSAHVSNPIAGSIVYTDGSGNSTSLAINGSGSPRVTQSGSTLTFTLPDIGPLTHPYITFDVTLLAPSGTNSQSVNRFTNTGTIQCAQSACPKTIGLTDGFISYYSGSVPAQKEINP